MHYGWFLVAEFAGHGQVPFCTLKACGQKSNLKVVHPHLLDGGVLGRVPPAASSCVSAVEGSRTEPLGSHRAVHAVQVCAWMDVSRALPRRPAPALGISPSPVLFPRVDVGDNYS